MAIVQVVKYDGGPDVFAWKYPNSELGTWTQLIVNESQEAILFKGGIACDVFGAGRHTLETANIPILNKFINLPFGGDSPFSAEIWFINKVYSLDIKWGTATPIQLQDPKYKVFLPVRAYGQFGIQIEDAKKFLIKLVGTLPIFDKENITKYFRGLYLTKVKDVVSSYLIHKQVSILEINAYLNEISNSLLESMASTFEEYGIKIISFYVNDINVPEDDDAVIKLKNALSKRAEMDIVGYNYQQERSFDTLEGAATNPGSLQGGLMGAGIGLGMGLGVGETFGQQMGGISDNINVKEIKKCPNCNTEISDKERFCHNCGYDINKKTVDKTVNNEVKCSSCGTKLSENTKFCSECGKKYNPCHNCKADLPENAVVCPLCGEAVPIECPSCGAQISATSKFCSECGFSLIKHCDNCGYQMKGKEKFCPECGKKL